MALNSDNIKIKKKDTNGLMSINTEGYEVLDKIVKSSGKTGRIYLPSSWIGCRVKIVRIEPIEDDDD